MLGENVRRMRKEKRLTQYALADMAGIRQSMVSRIETTDPDVRLGTLNKLRDALGCSWEDLLA